MLIIGQKDGQFKGLMEPQKKSSRQGGDKTILITGATGFLGSHLTRHLIDLGHRILVLKRSTSRLDRIIDIQTDVQLLDIESVNLDQLFGQAEIDAVIHCATNYGRSELEPHSVIEANLSLPLQLLVKSIEYNVKSFINTDTILDKRIGIYSMSKKQFFEWMDFYSDKISCINVALEHFYGPGDDPSKFVSFLVKQILASTPSIDFTPGDQKRDFIFIQDVVTAFASIIESLDQYPCGVKKFEVGTGHKMKLREFAELVKKLAENNQTRLNFGALPYRKNEAMDTNVDIRELQALGWSPKVSTENGIRMTLQAEMKR